MRKLLVLAALALACREQHHIAPATEASTPSTATPAARTASSAPASTTGAGAVVVKRSDGSDYLTIHQANDVIEINYTADGAKHTLTGKPRDSGKRKYTVDGGPVLLEVKPGDHGFKVRSPDGTLRWKVKVSDDGIRISDNEESQNAIRLGDAKSFTSTTKTKALGVLELDKIPALQQYVILGELLSRGR